MAAFDFPIGVGMGSDIQGVTAQTDGNPNDLMGIFMNSAESFLHMWEQAEGMKME